MKIDMVLLAVLAACGPSTPPPTVHTAAPSPPAVPRFVAEPVAIPPALVVPATMRVCSTSKAPMEWVNKGANETIFDFLPVKVPLAYGPADIAPEGFRRHPDAIRLAIIGKTDRLVACYRSIASKTRVSRVDHPSLGMGLIERFNVELTVDPFGMAHDVSVKSDAWPVPTCLAETLATIRINGRTPRETRANVELVFMHVSDAKPAKLPPAEPYEGRPGCVRARDPMPQDSLDVEAVFIDIDPPQEPVRSPRCGHEATSKTDIRAAINSRLGSLRACYIDARKRIPTLAGIVETKFVVGPWGDFTEVEVDGKGDAQLWTCIKKVYAELAASRLPVAPVLVASLPLELDPSLPPDDFKTAGEALDADGAAAFAAKDAAAATTLDAACRARARLVQAYVGVPGGTDARFDVAFDAFVSFVGKHDRGQLGGCIADLLPNITAALRWPVAAKPDRVLSPWRDRGLTEAVARSQHAVAALPELEETMLPFIGDAQLALRDANAAIETYLNYLALGTRDKARIRTVADGYATATHARDHGPSLDPCEARVRF
jgi:hypothetical protein